ncbi:MAG TPA: sulfite oxidase [Nitrospira sp.]
MTGLFSFVGARLLLGRRLPQVEAAQERVSGETGSLTVRVTRPFNAETPIREFTSFLTPTHRFFVRSHFGPPPVEAIAETSWRLTVGGLVERPRTLSLGDLKQFPPLTLTAVLQCSGNGRIYHRPRVPGVQWDRGAVGNAQWTGVRLRDVLASTGISADARHVQFQGADRPAGASVPLFIRSIPLAKAVHPDTILAYEMNDHPLSLLHGAPVRVITPGWMAESCIKWLTDITVQKSESAGYYMQQAYRIPSALTEADTPSHGQVMLPVEAMVVKSLISAPSEGMAVVQGQPITIQGVAWSGEAPIVTVEVSCDDGATWETARFVNDEQTYAWRQWQSVWRPRRPGATAILCRATDARGRTQPAASPWNPSGFLWNGWDRISVTVTI